jgi:hypothetical protein
MFECSFCLAEFFWKSSDSRHIRNIHERKQKIHPAPDPVSRDSRTGGSGGEIAPTDSVARFTISETNRIMFIWSANRLWQLIGSSAIPGFSNFQQPKENKWHSYQSQQTSLFESFVKIEYPMDFNLNLPFELILVSIIHL